MSQWIKVAVYLDEMKSEGAKTRKNNHHHKHRKTYCILNILHIIWWKYGYEIGVILTHCSTIKFSLWKWLIKLSFFAAFFLTKYFSNDKIDKIFGSPQVNIRQEVELLLLVIFHYIICYYTLCLLKTFSFIFVSVSGETENICF